MTRHHSDEFRLTPAVIVRLLIFGIIIFGLVSFLSQSQPSNLLQPDPTLSIDEAISSNIIPKISQIVPEPAIIEITNKFNWLKGEISSFPQKQIDDLKKSVIQSIYDDLMKK